MKDRFKYFIDLLVLFIIPLSLFCQPDIKDSTEAEKEGKKLYHEKYIKGIDKKDISFIGQAFVEIEQFLNSNSYGKTANNFFLPLKIAYEQKKPLNDQFFAVQHEYVNSKKWEKKKLELLENYHSSLNNLTEPAEITADLEKKSERNPIELSTGKIICVWILTSIVFLIGFIMGAFLIYQYSQLQIYSILKKEKNKYLNDLKKDTEQKMILRRCFKYIGIVEILRRSKNDKQDGIDSITEAITQLKKQNEKLNARKENIEEVLVKQKNEEDNQELALKHLDEQPSKSIEVSNNKIEFFFTIPENDGSFKVANAKNNKEIDCFYKIELEKRGQTGKLEFISGDYDLRALDNIDYYLNPVCEIQNIADRKNARKIQMISHGTIIKSGDNWKIDEKNKVKIKLV